MRKQTDILLLAYTVAGDGLETSTDLNNFSYSIYFEVDTGRDITRQSEISDLVSVSTI